MTDEYLQRLMSIDYNATSICWALWDDGTYRMSGRMESELLLELLTAYGKFIVDMGVTDIVIEKLFIGPNAMSVKKLATVHGAIQWETLRNGVGFHSIYPATWKSRTLGSARATKKDSIRHVLEVYNFELKDHNVADAIGIGECWLKEKNL